MIGRNAAWRCGGVLALAAAAGTSLLHRNVLAAHIAGPATGLELVFGLASFALASVGVLLLIHGAGLRDGWVEAGGADSEQAEPNTLVADPYALAAGRAEIAMLLADRAIRAAADSRKHSPNPLDTIQTGHAS